MYIVDISKLCWSFNHCNFSGVGKFTAFLNNISSLPSSLSCFSPLLLYLLSFFSCGEIWPPLLLHWLLKTPVASGSHLLVWEIYRGLFLTGVWHELIQNISHDCLYSKQIITSCYDLLSHICICFPVSFWSEENILFEALKLSAK